MSDKDVARFIADTYPVTDPAAPLVRYYRVDGTMVETTEEARYMTRYNPLTKRLRVLLHPHHETVGSFYLGN